MSTGFAGRLRDRRCRHVGERSSSPAGRRIGGTKRRRRDDGATGESKKAVEGRGDL